MIEVIEAQSKKQMKQFVQFPFELYKNSKHWVPPIISEELDGFDPKKNPAFLTAQVKFYLAFKNNKIVGRVAAIINWDEVKILNKSKVRFGWFDVIDDVEVTKALINKVEIFGKENNLEHMEGPMGFSNLDKVGCLINGFDEQGLMITWYNYPYYAQHFENLGFNKEKVYLESKFPFSNIDATNFQRFADMIEKRYNLHHLNFSNTKDIMPLADKMFELFNNSYASLQSFVPINDIQIAYFKKKYIGFINPDFIKFVMDENNNMVAFSIVMPNFADALQKIKGKLFPTGFYHLLQARKKSKTAVFYLIGVLPEYQSKGVTSILFNENHKTFTKLGITTCMRTPELEDNHAIHNLWKNFKPEYHKKRCTFIKQL
jgi:GNAT superfamily N-acetyltransferase